MKRGRPCWAILTDRLPDRVHRAWPDAVWSRYHRPAELFRRRNNRPAPRRRDNADSVKLDPVAALVRAHREGGGR